MQLLAEYEKEVILSERKRQARELFSALEWYGRRGLSCNCLDLYIALVENIEIVRDEYTLTWTRNDRSCFFNLSQSQPLIESSSSVDTFFIFEDLNWAVEFLRSLIVDEDNGSERFASD